MPTLQLTRGVALAQVGQQCFPHILRQVRVPQVQHLRKDERGGGRSCASAWAKVPGALALLSHYACQQLLMGEEAHAAASCKLEHPNGAQCCFRSPQWHTHQPQAKQLRAGHARGRASPAHLDGAAKWRVACPRYVDSAAKVKLGACHNDAGVVNGLNLGRSGWRKGQGSRVN